MTAGLYGLPAERRAIPTLPAVGGFTSRWLHRTPSGAPRGERREIAAGVWIVRRSRWLSPGELDTAAELPDAPARSVNRLPRRLAVPHRGPGQRGTLRRVGRSLRQTTRSDAPAYRPRRCDRDGRGGKDEDRVRARTRQLDGVSPRLTTASVILAKLAERMPPLA